MNKALVQIAEHYHSSHQQQQNRWEQLCTLAKSYAKEREQKLLDAVAAAMAVHTLVNADRIDTSAITPQMREAFTLAFPDKELDWLRSLSPEQLDGVVSAWKGKYFEVLVRDQLNAGEWVGDLHLLEGQQAVIAESLNQTGWDLQILNPDGSVAQELQLKATESLGYLKEALEKLPHIQIVSTEEVGQVLQEHFPNLFVSDVSNEELTEAIRAPIESLYDTGWENFLEDVMPLLPFVIIAVGEGRHVLVGRKSFTEAASSALERAAKTTISIVAGAAVAWLFDAGLISVPVSILTRLSIDRYQILKRASERADRRKQGIIAVTEHYRALSAPAS